MMFSSNVLCVPRRQHPFFSITPAEAGIVELLASFMLGIELVILSIRWGCDILNDPSSQCLVNIPRYSSIVPSYIILKFVLRNSLNMSSTSASDREIMIHSSTTVSAVPKEVVYSSLNIIKNRDLTSSLSVFNIL